MNEKEERSCARFVTVDGKGIAFNCPPESVKVWAQKGLGYPEIIVIGDTPILQGVALACPEFPFLKALYVGGGLKNGQVRPLVLVGEEERVKAAHHALRLCFHGPSSSELKRIGVNKSDRLMLLSDQQYFAPKRNGQVIPFEEFVIQAPFKDGRVTVNGLEFIHTGVDSYEVVSQSGRQEIRLHLEGEIGPTWPIPVLKNVEVPHQFRLFALGSDSGFGPGPTTGFLLEMSRQFMLWDCPPYATWTLAANGISPEQISAIVVSHGHDDHVNDMVKFAQNREHKTEIIGTKEVLFTIQVKLAAMMKMTVERLKHFFRWRIIKVGQTIKVNGYLFQFHYGFHPIPSLGAFISHNGEHVVTFTGDTGFTDVLASAAKVGAITSQRQKAILDLVNHGDPTFVDAGEAMIHGRPAEFTNGNGDCTHIRMYHRTSLPPELQKKAHLVRPGNFYAVHPTDTKISDMSLIAKVLSDLKIRDWSKWTKILGEHCVEQFFEKDSLIIQKDSLSKEYFYIVAHGEVWVLVDDQIVAKLGCEDFFGEQALLTGKARNATIWSNSTVRLLAIPGDLFQEMMEEDQRLVAEDPAFKGESCAIERLRKIWGIRMVISQVRALKDLSAGLKNELASKVTIKEFSPGQVVVRQDSVTDEVYIVVKGKVEVRLDRPNVKNPILEELSLFGENVALGFADKRTATVEALEPTEVYIIPGGVFRRLYEEVPRFRFEIIQLAQERGVSGGTARS